MLLARGVSSRRLARVWMVFLLARGEETLGVFPFECASSGFFLHVVQSAMGGTPVNSLLCFYCLLHSHQTRHVSHAVCRDCAVVAASLCMEDIVVRWLRLRWKVQCSLWTGFFQGDVLVGRRHLIWLFAVPLCCSDVGQSSEVLSSELSNWRLVAEFSWKLVSQYGVHSEDR